MTPRAFAFTFLFILTALRLATIGNFPLFPDEAYYSMWSERMDWSFFSKGPGVAATMWLSTHLLGVSEFGLRFFSPLLGLGTSLMAWALARRLYDESVAAWTVLLVNVLPIFTVGTLVMTIDPLSIFFWSAALYTGWRALEKSPVFSLWWPLTGLLIGLGFLAKYTNAMQLLSLILLLAFTARYRREFKRPGLYTLLAAFGVCTIPVLIWNSRHAWITVEHLTARGGLNQPWHFEPQEFLAFLGMHFGVYSPLVFLGMIVAVVASWRKARHSLKTRYLLAFTLPLFLLYFWLSLKQAGEANWTAPAALSLGILAVACWHEWSRRSAAAGAFSVIALLLSAAISLVTLNPDIIRAAGFEFPYEKDPARRMRGWKTAAERVSAFRKDYEARIGEPVFLIANEHEVAASLAFYMKDMRPEGPGHPPVYIPAEPFFEDQFSFWPRYDQLIERPKDLKGDDIIFTEEEGYNPFRGRTALYITDRGERKAPSSIKRGFESWEMIAAIDQKRRGQPLRQLRIFACRNFLDPGVR